MTRTRGSLIQAAFKVLPGDHLFTDGSCRQDAMIGKPHTGFSILAVDARGQFRAVVHGSAPAEYPQTAVAAEAWAAMRAVEMADGTATIQSDSAAVTGSFSDHTEAMGPGKCLPAFTDVSQNTYGQGGRRQPR